MSDHDTVHLDHGVKRHRVAGYDLHVVETTVTFTTSHTERGPDTEGNIRAEALQNARLAAAILDYGQALGYDAFCDVFRPGEES